ncbi:phosphopantetheine attachment site family protein [Nocardiopsis alba]|jgi:methoxymalonate biosynthesis acyl carrier protein|uniref:Phosphopantetheine attachment site family protein n=3 Tax=Nocardiopsis alba TaxID=53437 RepID=A0A7K2IT20_9ACTN|nr:phosphopantetheine attachment site family protein [Nocardiopsis alba ATCC BAA-2165]MYR32964.1 phosphopantetheine attachment site family protein [Nocardiopsis alba]
MHDSGTPVDAAPDMDVRESIRGYIKDNIASLGEDGLRDDDNIFEKGFVTSMFAMQLLAHIESAFDVEVPDEHLNLHRFSSVERMAEMVSELRAVRRE